MPRIRTHNSPLDDVNKTTAEDRYYVDFDNGDDSNSGASWDDAFATINGLNAELPRFMEHDTVVTCSGVLDTGEPQTIDRYIAGNVSFLLDGDWDAKDTLVAERISTTASTSAIADSTLSLTPDEHKGCILEMTSGAASGQRRTIQGHDATTFTPCRLFSATPVAGDTFIVYRPATRIQDTLHLAFEGPGFPYVQNFTTHVGNSNQINVVGSNVVSLSAIVSYSSSTFSALSAFASGGLWIGGTQRNNADISFISTSTAFTSFGMAGTGKTLIRGGANLSTLGGAVLNDTDIYETLATSTAIGFGARIKGKLSVSNIGPASSTSPFIRNFSSYNPIRIDSSADVGLEVRDSSIDINGDVIIENNASHGIDISRHASVNIVGGTISGTGNGGAGVRTHGFALMTYPTAGPPTVTGATPGDVSVDGSSQASTWATITAGTPMNDTSEFALVKAV